MSGRMLTSPRGLTACCGNECAHHLFRPRLSRMRHSTAICSVERTGLYALNCLFMCTFL